MNKLLFTLSLVVLVAVPFASSAITGNLSAIFNNDIKRVILEKINEKCVTATRNQIVSNEVQATIPKAQQCFENFVRTTKSELARENEKMQGSPPEIQKRGIKKVCDKKEDFMKCVTPVTSSLDPCLDTREEEQRDILVKIINRVYDFVCEKESALFIGFLDSFEACSEEQKEDIEKCSKRIINKYSSDKNEFIIDEIGEEEQCKDTFDLEDCMVKELKDCKEQASGEFIDGIFDIISAESKCKRAGNDGVSKHSVQISLIVGSALMAFF